MHVAVALIVSGSHVNFTSKHFSTTLVHYLQAKEQNETFLSCHIYNCWHQYDTPDM